MGSFVFRWPYPANDVHVTGTFDDWGKSEQMDRVGDHWEKEVDLPSADEKVLYKFVVDDEWVYDDNAPKEGDGHWNINNVLYPDQIKPKPKPELKSQPEPIAAASESKATEKSDDSSDQMPGAFPETPYNDNQTFGVRPIPASGGIGNPISLPAGAPVPDQKDITSNTVESTVTTSKEDYEAGGKIVPTPQKEASEYSVNPLPAFGGTGNPVQVPAGSSLPAQKDVTSNTVQSGVRTSKEDYENSGAGVPPPEPEADDPSAFSVKPIPASGGIGNPIKLAPGAPIPDQKDITPNTVESTVTTSKEAYENSGSSLPNYAAGAAIGALGGAAAGSAFSVPKEKQNLIPESSLPMGGSKMDTLDAGPFIRSSGPGTTTSELASRVPLENQSFNGFDGPDASTAKLASELEIPLKTSRSISSSGPPTSDPTIRSSGPGTTTSDLASRVPLESASTVRSSGPDTTTGGLASKVPIEGDSTLKASAAGATTGALASKALEDTDPTIRSSGPGTTTADLAAKALVENDPAHRSGAAGTTTADTASYALMDNQPTIRSSGPETTTGALASKVPVESDPTIRSSGPGTTTGDLASKVPLETDPASKSSESDATTGGLAAAGGVVAATALAAGGAAVAGGALVAGGVVAASNLLDEKKTGVASDEAKTSPDVPEVVQKSITSAHEAPEAASSSEAVKEKADVEKELLGSSHAGQAATESAGATTYSSSVPDVVQKSIASAHQAPEAASSSEAVKEKSDVEKELLSKAAIGQTSIQPISGETAASTVPAVVQKSITSAHEAPEAASSSEAVKEKANVEKELLSSIHSNQATTQSTDAVAAYSSSVPAIVQKSITSAHEAPEAASSMEAVKEKADLEKELLSKTQISQASGVPASAAVDQNSYYGLAVAVPAAVEKSMQQSHAAPEAAAESSAVAEKSAVERELLTKVPSTDEAGEPAPTIAAVTSTTAPTSTSTAGVATSITDGKTANEPVPDTDTSSAARGVSAGELAGGAAVGGAAAAGAAALAARHKDADVEPPRVADSQKPDITTEASPATASKTEVPGQSRYAGAAIADGGADMPTATFPKTTAPVEKSEGATTEYAPLRTTAPGPGISSAAGAALSDGTEDPTLADEPAVKLMKHNEEVTGTSASTAAAATTAASSTGQTTGGSTVHDMTTTTSPTSKATEITSPITTTTATTSTTTPATTTAVPATQRPTTPPSKYMAESSTAGTHDPSATVAAAGIPSLTSAGTQAGHVEPKKDSGFSTTAANAAFATSSAPTTPAKKPTQGSAANSPATSTATSTATDKKKKRHSLRAWIKKVLD